MATNSDINMDFTEENVQAAQDILGEMKKQAEAAYENSDMFTHNILLKLIKLASPIVTSAFARLQREEAARETKRNKEMRLRAREQKQAAKQSEP
jgi:hypothetical protein